MKAVLSVVVLLLAVLGFSSLFVVEEGHRSIIIEFGKVKMDKEDLAQVYKPGLHFKMPLIATPPIWGSCGNARSKPSSRHRS